MEELISVIIPVYKVEPYLNRCIDSIINQSYSKLEIILVNDGSPDRCGEICNNYAKLDDRITVIHKKNGGLSDARNAGIEIAQGKYITFVDSDDWVNNEYIKRLYDLIDSTNADISMCNFIRTTDENIRVESPKVEVHEFSNIDALDQFKGKRNVQMTVSWGKLYIKKLFDGIRFPVGRVHEDEFITYKLIYRARKITVTNEQLLFYWQREDSIMGSGLNIKNELDRIDALEERANFFLEIGLIELSGITYRTVFSRYMVLEININQFKNIISKKQLRERLLKLTANLKGSQQSYLFKIFYELYYLSPETMLILFKVYKAIRKK